VGAEVVAMMYSGPLLSRLGTRRLMQLAVALTVVRWALLATGQSPAWLVPAQLLHAASFGLFHVAAVTHTHRLMPAALRATGQSLYSSLSFGLGLTVAMYLSGVYYDAVGAPMLFAASALIALAATALAMTLERVSAAPPEVA